MGTTTTSPPLAALAVLLLIFSFRCAAAARLPPAEPLVRHEDGVEDAAHGPALAAGLSTSEVMTEAEEACDDEECAQRRLLRDAHLDYIYTQHKGKP